VRETEKNTIKRFEKIKETERKIHRNRKRFKKIERHRKKRNVTRNLKKLKERYRVIREDIK